MKLCFNFIARSFRFISQEFLYGLHFLALGAAAIVFSVQVIIGIRLGLIYPIIIYLVAYDNYLYNRYREIKLDTVSIPNRANHLRKYYSFSPLILAFTIFILFFLLVLDNNIRVIWYVLFLLLGGFFYTEFIKGLTKKIPLFKNFFVAFLWTFPVLFIPFYYSIPFNTLIIIFSIFVFMKTFVINCFFDFKDVKVDSEKGLKTMPVIFGVKNSVYLLGILSSLSALFIISMIIERFVPFYTSFLLFSYLFNLYCLRKSILGKLSFSNLYFVAGMEFIFWPVLIIIGKIII